MDKKQIKFKSGHPARIRESKNTSGPVKKSRFYWMPTLCIMLALIAYFPVFKAGFVSWDDDDYVLKNQSITTFENIKEILSRPVQGNYHPLTMLSLAVNYAISGEKAGSYHVVNLLLHLLNILLVFLFIKKLTGNKPWIAFIVALLFAVHPLHVESVAWVSERKDLLYAFFFLAGLLLYLRYSETGKISSYLSVLGLFILSLLSKPAAVIFPVVLLAIDYYNGRLKTARTFYEKVPFLLLSILLGIMTLHAQKVQGSVGDAGLFPFYFRILFGFYGIMMYIVKAIWPLNLCAFYPFPFVNIPLPPVYYISPLVGISLFIALVFTFRKYRLMAFAILFYLINLSLVLQFMPVGSAVIADRYSYLPLIGVFLIPGYYFQQWIEKNNGKLPAIGLSVLAAVSVILSILTFRQSVTWKNSAALWDQAIRVSPSSVAYSNRGFIYKGENNFDKALEMYDNAVKLDKTAMDALLNRGIIYFNRQQFELAIADFNACLAIDSTIVMALENRGLAYGALGKKDLALADLNKAIQINPKVKKDALINRGNIYFNSRQFDLAIADYNACLAIDSTVVLAIENRGSAYCTLGKYDLALADLNKAILLNPETKNGYANRGVCYQMTNRNKEAVADFYRHMEVNHEEPADILNSIAISYMKLKEYGKALDVLSKAIGKEDKGTFHLNRAMVYRELGRKTEARADALKAESLGATVDKDFMISIRK